ncbi:hypothetical protein LR48_Vigan549s010700 [Vigna angularis]|uniref:Uncharacterized protein n=1 Tax=Phaseolus angularis TaxID=3914 RepID=A0A0L9TDG5_PHAAN|nr:hypothetical protein LR48_Vigan549s010700 [Vigna angularis]
MTGQDSERPDKGKGVARPKRRQRQTPKYVLMVPATLPTTVAPSSSSVGPPPTPAIHPPPTSAIHPPPTPAVDPTPTSAIHPPPTPAIDPTPTSAIHHSPTPATDPLPPPVIITPTPSPMLIIPTPPPTVTPSADPNSAGDGEGVDPPLHDRPWIEPYGKGFIPSRVASRAITRSIKQQFLSPCPTWGAIPDDDKKPLWQCFQAQALGRAIHVDEVFAQTHVRKGTNEIVDERSRKTHEEFSTRLSQVRSEHGSAPTPDDASNAKDKIPSRGGTLKHQPSSSTTTADEAVVCLTQALEQHDQEITDLRAEFKNFKALVMRVLPETSQDPFIIPATKPRPSSSPTVPQQPTSVQPSSVQPTSVQPTLEEQADEDHSDDNYVDY